MAITFTRTSRHANAPRTLVYRALLDARGRDMDGATWHDQPLRSTSAKVERSVSRSHTTRRPEPASGAFTTV
jgi:hypothetical protein